METARNRLMQPAGTGTPMQPDVDYHGLEYGNRPELPQRLCCMIMYYNVYPKVADIAAANGINLKFDDCRAN